MIQFGDLSKWVQTTTSLVLMLSLLAPELAANTPHQTPEQMKAAMLKRGTGEKAQVKVRMKNGHTLKGYVSFSNDAGFSLVTKEQTRTIAYSEVASIDKKGMRLAAKAAIVVGVVLGALVAILYAACGTHSCL